MILKRIWGQLFAGAEPAPVLAAASDAHPTAPVPARLRERLAAYPGHIERLQEVLTLVANEEPLGIPRIDLAVWALEGRLGSFLTEARNELDAARAAEAQGGVADAEAKVRLMSEIRLKQAWIGDAAFGNYFDPREAKSHD